MTQSYTGILHRDAEMKNNFIEQVKEAHTPEEMRAEIFRLEHYDPLVRSVMDGANYSGASAEDKYTTLAYQALRERNRFQSMCMEYAAITPLPPFIVDDKALAAIKGG